MKEISSLEDIDELFRKFTSESRYLTNRVNAETRDLKRKVIKNVEKITGLETNKVYEWELTDDIKEKWLNSRGIFPRNRFLLRELFLTGDYASDVITICMIISYLDINDIPMGRFREQIYSSKTKSWMLDFKLSKNQTWKMTTK